MNRLPYIGYGEGQLHERARKNTWQASRPGIVYLLGRNHPGPYYPLQGPCLNDKGRLPL